MKTKIILFIIISILFTGCSPSQASTSSEQPEQSAPQSNPSADNQQLSQAQFEEIFDFYCEEQLTDFDGIEVIPALHGIDEEAFAISGEIVNGQLIYQCVTDYIAPQLFGITDLQKNMVKIYSPTFWEESRRIYQEVADGKRLLSQTLKEQGFSKGFSMEQHKLDLKYNDSLLYTHGLSILIFYDEDLTKEGSQKRSLRLGEVYLPVPIEELSAQEEIQQALFSSDLNLQNTKAMLLEYNPLRMQPSILFYDGEKEYIMSLWDMVEETRIGGRQLLPPDVLAPVEYKADYRQYQLFPVTDFAQDYISEREYQDKQYEIRKAYYEEHNLPWPPVS